MAPSAAAYNPFTHTWTIVAPPQYEHFEGGMTLDPEGRIILAGGSDGDGGDLIEEYGPSIDLQPQRGLPGASVVLTGTNFAANATVTLYWGATLTGTAFATGVTNGNGDLTTPITFTVPQTARYGLYKITAMDPTSQYPVHLPFRVDAAPGVTPAATGISGKASTRNVSQHGIRNV